jgi:hypothetical protein
MHRADGDTYKILVGNSEGNKSLATPKVRIDDVIKMYHKEARSEGVDGTGQG